MLGQGGVCQLGDCSRYLANTHHSSSRPGSVLSPPQSVVDTLIKAVETKDYICREKAIVGAFSVIVITKVDLRIQL